MDQLEYLESERIKIWERISNLETKIETLRPETEQEASNASRKTSEFRNRAKTSADEIAKLHADLNAHLSEFSSLNKKATEDASSLKQLIQTVTEEHNKLLELNKDANEAKEAIEATLNASVEARELLDEKNSELDDVEKTLGKTQELQRKLELQFKNSSEVAEKIQDVSTEIFGYEEEEDNGDVTKVEGLKDKLDKSYNDLSKKAGSLNDGIDKSITDMDLRLVALHDEWSEKHNVLNKRIESLLPRALTAGLSHAYSTKKEDELSEGKRIARVFYGAIAGLVLVSLIPFGVAVHAVLHELGLQEAIGRMPRLVLAILPLYIPVIWVAYSANRRGNLSKRLVEEYSHKEVLAKTYEGLAKQVSELPSDISLELRTKLLYNILEISAENPGKLISDYNKSDHPLMDALDKSVQLTNAVERLSRLPGFSKVAMRMKEKADSVLEEENKKAIAGLKSLEREQ